MVNKNAEVALRVSPVRRPANQIKEAAFAALGDVATQIEHTGSFQDEN